MKRAKVVIGAAYGDEGKGLITDYLSTIDTLVVRFNGGAQAGHTVVTPTGQRHVFKHVSAGTFSGASTLLSRYFLVNPVLFREEAEKLQRLLPMIYVDARACVTTPFDMLLNQTIENSRGDRRHGSVGLGINETVVRSEHLSYQLTVGDLLDNNSLDILERIEQCYLPERARQLGITIEHKTDGWIERFLEDARFFLENVVVANDIQTLQRHDTVLFEGAQGLRLDAHSKDFPHVTRSRTGIHNVIELAAGSGIGELDVHYVTRAYATRHGNGPLYMETKGHPFGWSGPETNVTNEFQGSFRYGFLEPTRLVADIVQDMSSGAGLKINGNLAVTCLDQLSDRYATATLFKLDRVLKDIPIQIRHVSMGPTRANIYDRVRESKSCVI